MLSTGCNCKVAGLLECSLANAFVNAGDDRTHEFAQFPDTLLAIICDRHRAIGKLCPKCAVQIFCYLKKLNYKTSTVVEISYPHIPEQHGHPRSNLPLLINS